MLKVGPLRPENILSGCAKQSVLSSLLDKDKMLRTQLSARVEKESYLGPLG